MTEELLQTLTFFGVAMLWGNMIGKWIAQVIDIWQNRR